MISPQIKPKIVGFDRVILGVEVCEDVRAKLRTAFIDQFPWTQSADQVDFIFLKHLGGATWTWPSHSRWSARFQEVGAIPFMWRRPVWGHNREMFDVDGGRLALLSHTIRMAGHSAAPAEFNRSEFPWCAFDVIKGEPAPIENIIDGRIADYFEAREGSTLPPFFPGDRTGVMVATDNQVARNPFRLRYGPRQ